MKYLKLLEVHVFEKLPSDKFSIKIQYNINEMNSVGMFSDYQENILTYNKPSGMVNENTVVRNYIANNIGLDMKDIYPKMEN